MTSPARVRAALKASHSRLKHELLFGTLLYPYGAARHSRMQKGRKRSQNHSYTCFYRSPGQLEASTGPVLRYLLRDRAPGPLLIHIFASSNGAEAYSLASALLRAHPDLDFRIRASDQDPLMVERGQRGLYSHSEVHHRSLPRDFVRTTFDRGPEGYRVKEKIRERVNFDRLDLLDPSMTSKCQPADMVLLQNLQSHIEPELVRMVFWRVLDLLKPRAALYLDGMSLGLRARLTAQAELVPMAYKTREIHEFARSHFGARWWNYYCGMEPYATWRRDRTRRFGTIFLSDESRQRRCRRRWSGSLGEFWMGEF